MQVKLKFLRVLCILLTTFLTNAYGQSDFYNMCQSASALNFGFVVNGTIVSKITGVKTMILSEPYFLGYKDEEKSIRDIKSQLGGGIFVHYKFPNSYLGLENEIVFSQQGGIYSFQNTQTDFNYDLAFRHQFINIMSLLRFYPGVPELPSGSSNGGLFYLGLGPRFGANVAQERIYYTSGGSGKLPEFGEDLQQQQQIRNVLKGRNDFGFTGEIGFMIPAYRTDISLRYHHGLSDLIETVANPYNFIETKNRGYALQLSIKITISNN